MISSNSILKINLKSLYCYIHNLKAHHNLILLRFTSQILISKLKQKYWYIYQKFYIFKIKIELSINTTKPSQHTLSKIYPLSLPLHTYILINSFLPFPILYSLLSSICLKSLPPPNQPKIPLILFIHFNNQNSLLTNI